MNSAQKSELQELLSYLNEQERAELEAILAATPEPMTIIRQVVRPDGSIEGYLIEGDDEKWLPPDHPLLVGRPPATPEINGGYWPGERPGDIPHR